MARKKDRDDKPRMVTLEIPRVQVEVNGFASAAAHFSAQFVKRIIKGNIYYFAPWLGKRLFDKSSDA
jgi:hypothetical protein